MKWVVKGVIIVLLSALLFIIANKFNSSKIEITNTFSKVIVGKPDSYNLYKEDILNGSDPILYDSLIAVNYVDGGWVKADLTSEWYSYENFNWANAVVVKNSKKDFYNNSDVGTQILKDDTLGFFVWIPRFEYKFLMLNLNLLKNR